MVECAVHDLGKACEEKEQEATCGFLLFFDFII
jgi:hypothetical protein